MLGGIKKLLWFYKIRIGLEISAIKINFRNWLRR